MKSYQLFIVIFLGLLSSCDQNQEAKVELGDELIQPLEIEVEKPKEEFAPNVVSKIDHFFSYRNKIGRFNGVILFADGDKVFEKAYGYSNFRNKDSLNIETSFQLASVSKPVTAIATLILKEEGKLSLSDSVQKFIPDFPYKGITIEQLLSHRSGLGNYVYWTGEYWGNHDSLMSNNDVLMLMAEHVPSMYYRPNQRYSYNNTNYELLASIIERVSGESFGKFLEDNIFKPLDMDHTFLYTKKSFEENDAATGYKTKRRPYSPFFLDGVHGDKGLYSSVGDLFKLDRALRDGKLLSDSTIAEAYTNRSKSYRKPYGLGWRLDEYNGKKIIYHHGWWRGFRSYFVRSIEDDKTIIVLTNMINGSKLNNDILLDLLFNAEADVVIAENSSVKIPKNKV
ncbi:MAG: beta-lactamase family protein [Flavobacteriales bacterium]|nr:beta-lactamase family protein [Flavobacteriales bacterium]